MLNEKKPDIDGYRLYDSICIKYQELANSQKLKVDQWLSGAKNGKMGSNCLVSVGFLFGGDGNVLDSDLIAVMVEQHC